VVDLVGEALNDRGRALKGTTVGVIGVAFKPNVRDARNSPAGPILSMLTERGAEVLFHDPHVTSFQDASGVERDSNDLDAVLARSDIILIVTAHRAIDWDRVFAEAPLVVDTTNSSRDRAVRPRQVLRLGAGWSGAERQAVS
jgi:UDP-N-acetyl-D-glucosamine dehydrogenase